MNTQPTALRLADALERDMDMNWPDWDNGEACVDELRRLHRINCALLDFVDAYLIAWDQMIADDEHLFYLARNAKAEATGEQT